MNAPIDTALLKHGPDHLTPLTEVERAAKKLTHSDRQKISKFLAWIFFSSQRQDQAAMRGPAVTARL